MVTEIATIGVYGFDEETFFAALVEAGVDTLCDVRWRRGVRGATYAFANSQRLQRRLAELGFRYLHRRDLAPPPALRACQQAADKASGTAKRQRTTLAPAFVAAYQEEILSSLQPELLRVELGADVSKVVLLCVERAPTACHRSLLAAALAKAWDVPVEHIVP
jgi:uncharacterized protein (DUF488 family)